MGVGWGVVLDQAESWILGVRFGPEYYGIHAFYLFLMKILPLEMEMVELKQEVESYGLPCLFTFCEILFFFLIFDNI